MRKTKLGQNFLFDTSIAERIVDSAGITASDTVLEIGPGYGTLTRLIARRVKHLTALEIDKKIYGHLRNQLADYDNITLIHGDVMKYDFNFLKPFKVIANIPYYITTPILFKLIDEGKNLLSMTLTMQKEVAERIVASPGNKSYGVLSLMVQFYGKAEIRFGIPASAFSPRPKVDSAVIHIDKYDLPPVRVQNIDIFKKIIKTSFANRRKMLANTLKRLYPDIRRILSELTIDPSKRPETLSMEDFARIANRIAEAEYHAC